MAQAKIHPTALVDAKAELDSSVEVGPYAVIGPHVQLDAGCTVGSHACIEGHTRAGRDNRFFQFISVGAPPQDKKYAGEPTRLEIGHGNTFREFVTLNTGTAQDHGVTRIGDDNWIMAYVHVAHDCQLGSHIILANAVQLAGHVHLADWVFLGGLTGEHQFVRVGAHAMSAFQSRLAQDVPPFMTVGGNPAAAQGVNAEGLRRRGFSAERIANIKQMQRLIYRQGLTLDAARAKFDALIETLTDDALRADVSMMQAFLHDAPRGIVR